MQGDIGNVVMLTQRDEESILRKKGTDGKKRQTLKKKGVNELREKRAKRKKWRGAKHQARARNRASALLQSEIPPSSPAETPENQREPGRSRSDHWSVDLEECLDCLCPH